jgi:signal transduction histidine kinase
MVSPKLTDIRAWPRVVLVVIFLAGIALAARLLISVEDSARLPWYVTLLVAFFALFSLVWVLPSRYPRLLHCIFLVQSATVLALLALGPEFDYVTGLFVLLAYQAAMVFRGWSRRLWIVAPIVLIGASLMVFAGPLEGLGLALTTMAIGMAMAALAVAGQEIEAAKSESDRMLAQLERTNAELKRRAAQADELAALQERNRLARKLHDSVSQAVFGILLTVRSAQVMRLTEPEGVQEQLALLQELTREALARMRAFIADLRPKS